MICSNDFSKLPIDENDVAFLFEDLHRGRSVVSPNRVPTRPVLLRWDIDRPLSLENCIVMDSPEADTHVQEGLVGWDELTKALVYRRQEEVRRYKNWIM
jgi:tRNA threonylcarbamoyladenosine dehydratase